MSKNNLRTSNKQLVAKDFSDKNLLEDIFYKKNLSKENNKRLRQIIILIC